MFAPRSFVEPWRLERFPHATTVGAVSDCRRAFARHPADAVRPPQEAADRLRPLTHPPARRPPRALVTTLEAGDVRLVTAQDPQASYISAEPHHTGG